MDVAYPYLGTCWSRAVDWDPLANRANYFDNFNGRAYDHADPWQFTNFLV
jgi:homospermidine synthase